MPTVFASLPTGITQAAAARPAAPAPQCAHPSSRHWKNPKDYPPRRPINQRVLPNRADCLPVKTIQPARFFQQKPLPSIRPTIPSNELRAFPRTGSLTLLGLTAHVPLAMRAIVPQISRLHPMLHRGLAVLAHHGLLLRVPRQLPKRLCPGNPCGPALVTPHRTPGCAPHWVRRMHI